MQFMERDERDQLKIMQDPKWKFQNMMEKLIKIRDKRLSQVEQEQMKQKLMEAVEKDRSFRDKSNCFTPNGAVKQVGDRSASIEKATPQLPRKSYVFGSKVAQSRLDDESFDSEHINFPKKKGIIEISEEDHYTFHEVQTKAENENFDETSEFDRISIQQVNLKGVSPFNRRSSKSKASKKKSPKTSLLFQTNSSEAEKSISGNNNFRLDVQRVSPPDEESNSSNLPVYTQPQHRNE